MSEKRANGSEYQRGYRAHKHAENPAFYRERYRDVVKPWKMATRDEAIRRYGGECVSCGESDPLVLCFDHVENDGAKHRREMGPGSYVLAAWLKRHGWPQGIVQILCANCNLKKERLTMGYRS